MPTAKVILENVFGMLGIVFWSFQLLPQVIANYKAKTTEGLSASMFLLWGLASLGFGSYSIVERLSIPIILQPHLFGLLSATCFLQCLYYRHKTFWSRRKTILVSLLMLVLSAGVEVGTYFATLAGVDHNVPGTMDAAGVLPVVFLFLGFLPQYADFLRYHSVKGVSMAFITADASGSVFSLISLALREKFDLLAAMNYIIVFVCDLIVVGFYFYYAYRDRKKGSIDREQAAVEGVDETGV